MKFLVPLLALFGVAALAQTGTPVPTATPSTVAAVTTAVVASGGILGWIALHGGFMAVVVAIVMMANAVLSAVRDFVAWLDGVPQGAPIPANYAGLTKLNVACVWIGKILDYVQGNAAH